MGVKVHACVGENAIKEDIKILKSDIQVIVGCPGRVLDMIYKGFM